MVSNIEMTASLQRRMVISDAWLRKQNVIWLLKVAYWKEIFQNINYPNAWKFIISHGYPLKEMSASGNYMPSIHENPNRWKEALNRNETLWSLPLICLSIFVLWENCQSASADSLNKMKNQISWNIIRPYLCRSCPIILKCSVQNFKMIGHPAWKLWANEISRDVCKISFGWVFYSATILVPFIDVCFCLVMGLCYLLSCLGTVSLKDQDRYLAILLT